MSTKFDFVKFNIEYISNLNKNNESRINMYTSLNSALIAIIFAFYAKGLVDDFPSYISTSAYALPGVFCFVVSLMSSLHKSVPATYNSNSIMLTSRIASFPCYDEYKKDIVSKFSNGTLDDALVEIMLEELYALAKVFKDREDTVFFTKAFFVIGLIMSIVPVAAFVLSR